MNLKFIREEKELTQKEVADILRVSRSVYAMWEVEKDIIPLLRLNDFCNYFNVSLDYALGFTKNIEYKYVSKEINKNIIKERLKNLRIKNNLTQEELASILKITRSLISKYETGTNLILTSFLMEYAKYFNISVDYLVGRIDKQLLLKVKIKQ